MMAAAAVCLRGLLFSALQETLGAPKRSVLADSEEDGVTSLMQVQMAPRHAKVHPADMISRIVFLHIPKTAGTSFIADAMMVIPSSIPFQDNGELSLLGTPRMENETRVVMIRHPLDHVLSQFLECKYDWWGKRVTAGTDFPFKEGTYGGLDEWVDHFTQLQNQSVWGFEPDSKEWARAVSHNCYNPWNMQSRYLASEWSHYVPYDELEPDLQVARDSLRSVQLVGVPELYVESLCLVHLETRGSLPDTCACGRRGPLEQISTESHYVPPHSLSELPESLLQAMSKLVRIDAQLYVDALNRFESALRKASARTGVQMVCEDHLQEVWANATALLDRLKMENVSSLKRSWNNVHVEVVATAVRSAEG